jgi:hypothetical protein
VVSTERWTDFIGHREVLKGSKVSGPLEWRLISFGLTVLILTEVRWDEGTVGTQGMTLILHQRCFSYLGSYSYIIEYDGIRTVNHVKVRIWFKVVVIRFTISLHSLGETEQYHETPEYTWIRTPYHRIEISPSVLSPWSFRLRLCFNLVCIPPASVSSVQNAPDIVKTPPWRG